MKRESTGTGVNQINENETVAKFEIMDGAPVRGESIPIRLFLGGFDALTPTFRNVNNKFSVKYHLNLVLIDASELANFNAKHTMWPTWRTLARRLTDEVGERNTGLHIQASDTSEIDEAFELVAGAMSGGAAG